MRKTAIPTVVLAGLIFLSLIAAGMIVNLQTQPPPPAADAILKLLPRLEQAPEPPPLLMGVSKITCIGDSITRMRYGFVERLRVYLNALYPGRNWQVVNQGIDGDTSSGVADRFQKDALGNGSELIVVLVGVNDIGSSIQKLSQDASFETELVAQYRSNIARIIAAAAQTHRPLVLMSPIIASEDTAVRTNKILGDMTAALRNLAAEKKIPFVDLRASFIHIIEDYRRDTGATDLILTSDGVHPTTAGHQVIVNSLLNALGVSTEDRRQVQRIF